MPNATRFLTLGGLLLGLSASASGARAQTFDETCPGLAEGLGGLIGFVVDDDSEMIMPGGRREGHLG